MKRIIMILVIIIANTTISLAYENEVKQLKLASNNIDVVLDTTLTCYEQSEKNTKLLEDISNIKSELRYLYNALQKEYSSSKDEYVKTEISKVMATIHLYSVTLDYCKLYIYGNEDNQDYIKESITIKSVGDSIFKAVEIK